MDAIKAAFGEHKSWPVDKQAVFLLIPCHTKVGTLERSAVECVWRHHTVMCGLSPVQECLGGEVL